MEHACRQTVDTETLRRRQGAKTIKKNKNSTPNKSIGVNISERKSGRERTKKRELVFFPPPGGATGKTLKIVQTDTIKW